MGYGLGPSLSFTINLVADGNTFPLSRQAGICVCKSITLVNIFGMCANSFVFSSTKELSELIQCSLKCFQKPSRFVDFSQNKPFHLSCSWGFNTWQQPQLYLHVSTENVCPCDGLQPSIWCICVCLCIRVCQHAGAQAVWKMSPDYRPSTLPFGYFCSVPSPASVA